MRKLLVTALGLLLTTHVLAETIRSSGTITGTVGEHTIDLRGTCSQSETAFEFWSDGTQFAVSRDVNGDDMYLNVQVFTMGGRTMASLSHSRNGERVYNGAIKYEEFDGSSIKGWKAKDSAALADLKISFPVLATFLKTFSGSGREGEGDPAAACAGDRIYATI